MTEKEHDYLQNFEVRPSQFYGLPKIHKSKSINEKCKNSTSSYVKVSNVNDLKLRPIVAGPSCLTHRFSNLIDILLRPSTKPVRNHLRESIDFLNSFSDYVPINTLFA